MIFGHSERIDLLVQLADSNALGQGYIFFGPEMVGKKAVALALAEFLETGKFQNTGKILEDAILVEPHGGHIGIDQIRELQDFLWKAPFVSARRTAVIDDCHLLTAQSQNALLKIAEEPPGSALLIFIISELEMFLPTLASRLHKIYFGPLPAADMEKVIAGESVKNRQALLKASCGLPGRALRLLHNDKNKMLYKFALKLLGSDGSARRAMLKEYLADENADPAALLSEAILALYSADRKTVDFLKEALSLRKNMGNFNLNPKLQLENLFIRPRDMLK